MEPEQWTLPYVQAAFRAWWLAEYSGRYLDDFEDESIVSPENLDKGKCPQDARGGSGPSSC